MSRTILLINGTLGIFLI